MIDTIYYLAVLLIFLRLVTFFTVIPSFFPSGTPNSFKLFLNMILSFVLVKTINIDGIKGIASNYDLIIAVLNEIITGLVLGYITSLSFYVIEMAGSLMDMQVGFSMMTMFDPNTKSNSTLLSRLLNWVAILIFFIIDGHHMLIKELVNSFSVVSLGKSLIFQDTITAIINVFYQYFIIGLKIALPIILIIIITDLAMGLVSRTVPQLNIMILGMPIKILVGIAAFLAAVPIIIKMMVAGFGHIPDAFKGIFKALPLIMIFSDERTEEATPKKKSEARKKGQVPRSKDVGIALTMIACTLIIATLGGWITSSLREDVIYFFSNGFKVQFDYNYLRGIALLTIWRILKVYLPVVLPIMILGIGASMLQTGFLITTEPLKPSLGKLNPLKGFKNMFSKRNFVDLIKNFIVITIVSYLGYSFIKENYSKILQLGNIYLPSLGYEIKNMIVSIFTKITLVLVVLAIGDYMFQRWMFNKEQRMTKQEVKEEFKQMEGDPQLKSKIKQKQREIASRRMMQAVPNATVVVTNPTHISVALLYEEGKSEAPKVVAKGADIVALKIKEIAKENNVPIIENKPLARLMYEQVDVDKEIPGDMYQAVAEILAVVYKMKKK